MASAAAIFRRSDTDLDEVLGPRVLELQHLDHLVLAGAAGALDGHHVADLLPISARATGEVTAISRFLMSASSSPTIR